MVLMAVLALLLSFGYVDSLSLRRFRLLCFVTRSNNTRRSPLHATLTHFDQWSCLRLSCHHKSTSRTTHCSETAPWSAWGAIATTATE